MTQSITPVWIDNVIVLAPYALIKAELYQAPNDLDLRAARGAMVNIMLGFGGSTSLTNGVDIKIYRTLNDNGLSPGSKPYLSLKSKLSTYKLQINASPEVTAGAVSFPFDGGAGTAYAVGDLMCLWGVTTVPTASGAVSPNHGVEFLTVSKGLTTPIVFDRVSRYDHHDNEWICSADGWTLWLPGGATYVFVFDYNDDSAGEAVCCCITAQTYDSDLVT